MRKTKLVLALSAASLMSSQALATNGMNMEGYGPVSQAMGGTAQAYNNGLGGMMNNPATMGMGREKGNRFQVGIGKLGPNVEVEADAAGVDQTSGGNSYFIPGFGYATKSNGLTWGVGILAQGGMGTEYGKADQTGSGDLFAFGDNSFTGAKPGVPLSGEENRSELSVGRIIFPVNKEINDKLTVGGSLDYVWAGMDIMMDMSGNQFATLAGNGNISGSMFTTFQGSFGAAPGQLSDVNWARFDFSNNDKYTGEAKATGLGGKLGMTYKVNNQLTLGASYHSQTALSDLEGDATLSFNADINGFGTQTIPLEGKIKVKDFQWPSTIAFGAAYQPNSNWLVTADYKRINWSAVMDKFNMVFNADATQASPLAAGFAGQELDVTLDQEWDDQNVVMLGTAYKYNKNLILRAGLNVANNPVPDEHLNPLFPATVERHYTVGFGYKPAPGHGIDFSLVHAPASKATGDGDLNNGIEISHGQTNWGLMYSYSWGGKMKTNTPLFH